MSGIQFGDTRDPFCVSRCRSHLFNFNIAGLIIANGEVLFLVGIVGVSVGNSQSPEAQMEVSVEEDQVGSEVGERQAGCHPIFPMSHQH